MATSVDSIGDQPDMDDETLEDVDWESAFEDQPGDRTPTTTELLMMIRSQQETIDQMQTRIDELERKVEDAEYQAESVDEVAQQLKEGRISGEAGADFVAEFVSTPKSQTRIDARAQRLFFRIIEERRVGKPVTSKQVINWFNLHDSANPSVQAQRTMERLQQHREDGFYIGDISLGKHRGQNCIWLNKD